MVITRLHARPSRVPRLARKVLINPGPNYKIKQVGPCPCAQSAELHLNDLNFPPAQNLNPELPPKKPLPFSSGTGPLPKKRHGLPPPRAAFWRGHSRKPQDFFSTHTILLHITCFMARCTILLRDIAYTACPILYVTYSTSFSMFNPLYSMRYIQIHLSLYSLILSLSLYIYISIYTHICYMTLSCHVVLCCIITGHFALYSTFA